ncbi:hypothetical protein N8X83_01200, partial [Alphaproteobacteria bacterium]|nr:hypothetical protein [Alphaproteobacteria bacterium]
QAKVLNKPGVLLISSVSDKILLHDFHNIKPIQSNYTSINCKGPCGLVNAFQYNNQSGCYDSLKIEKSSILKKNNLTALQRGDLKKNYLKLYINSVNCYKYFNIRKINMLIQETINLRSM